MGENIYGIMCKCPEPSVVWAHLGVARRPKELEHGAWELGVGRRLSWGVNSGAHGDHFRFI